MAKSDNTFIKNAALIGIGFLGLKYLIPLLEFPNSSGVNIDIDSPDFDAIYHNDAYWDNGPNYNESITERNEPLDDIYIGPADIQYDDSNKNNPVDDILIDPDPNPGGSPDGDNDSQKNNPVDRIIDFILPPDDINPNPGSGNSEYSKGDPRLDPDPIPYFPNHKPIKRNSTNRTPKINIAQSKAISKQKQITSKSFPSTRTIEYSKERPKGGLFGLIKGSVFDLLDESLIGDSTYLFSEQEIVDNERILIRKNNTSGGSSCQNFRINDAIRKVKMRKIFY